MKKENNFDVVELSKRSGFNRDVLEKVSRLIDVLSYINHDSFLRTHLALKGGTALNLILLDLPRLSVDIDLDYLESSSMDEVNLKRKLITDKLNDFMIKNDYVNHRSSKSRYALDSYVYRYTGRSGNFDNIKIEINYVLRNHIDPTIFVQLNSGLLTKDFKIHTLSKIEIIASKFTALILRGAARDLYDIYQLISCHIINNEEIEHLKKSFAFYYSINADYSVCDIDLSQIEKINQRKVKRELLPVLQRMKRFDLENVKQKVTEYIKMNLLFTESEKEYLMKFSQGIFKPELLFDDTHLQNRLHNHPMVKWKLINFIKKQD